ncbi:hypothetical protein Q7P35_004678 [Cladosporium inversicolor]
MQPKCVPRARRRNPSKSCLSSGQVQARPLSLLSASLGSAAAASAEARLQAVDEVADDGQDEQEDDDNDRDDDVAGHFGGWWEVVWVELLTGSEVCVWGWVYVISLCGTGDLVVEVVVIQQKLVSLVVVVVTGG